MSSCPLVYVITLNWNRCEDTRACLASLLELSYLRKRILLVDNASTDGTVEMVERQFPEVEIVVNPRNLGFGAGFNVGLRHALVQGADYVFIINNDAVVAPDILQEMLALFTGDVGMVAPKIYYHIDPMRLWSIGGVAHPLTLEIAGDARGEQDVGQWSTILERDFFAGCALLLSRQLLIQVGLFDERFFMYYEDSDLSRRVRQAGFRLLLAPQAHVWHKVAVSSGGSDSPNERYWMAYSSILFFRKHVRGWRWLVVLPSRTASAIKTVTRLLLHGRTQSATAYIRGLRDGLKATRRRDTLCES